MSEKIAEAIREVVARDTEGYKFPGHCHLATRKMFLDVADAIAGTARQEPEVADPVGVEGSGKMPF